MTYLSYLLWIEGYGKAAVDLYRNTEAALELASEHAYATDEWGLDDGATLLLEKVIVILDSQLDSVSKERYIKINKKLDCLLRVDIPRKLSANQAPVSAS